MAGKKWTFLRRFKALNYWNKVSIALGLLGIPALILAIWGIWLVYNPPKIQLKESQKTEIENFGGNPSEIEKLMQNIQDERNEAINDSVQVEFIEVISKIYKTIDSTSSITINEIFVDSTSGQKYRNDLTIRKNILGTKVKFLYRLNPFNNTTGKSEILNFKKHVEASSASKGILITKGKFDKKAFSEAKKSHISLARFRESKSESWEAEKRIPVMVKQIIGITYVDFRSDQIEDKSNYKNIELSIDDGKSVFYLLDFIRSKWNRGDYYKIYKSLVKSINVEEPNMKLRFSEDADWKALHKLRLRFEFEEIYWFKHIKPEDFIELKNEIENEVIYAEYAFSPEQLIGFKEWEEVKSPTELSKRLPNIFTLEMMILLDNKPRAEYDVRLEDPQSVF